MPPEDLYWLQGSVTLQKQCLRLGPTVSQIFTVSWTAAVAAIALRVLGHLFTLRTLYQAAGLAIPFLTVLATLSLLAVFRDAMFLRRKRRLRGSIALLGVNAVPRQKTITATILSKLEPRKDLIARCLCCKSEENLEYYIFVSDEVFNEVAEGEIISFGW